MKVLLTGAGTGLGRRVGALLSARGATVVAAIWGIFIWKEFKDAPAGTSRSLNLMLLLYVIGIAMIIYAR